MKTRYRFIIISFFLLSVWVQQGFPAEDGKELFVTKCGKCHTRGDAPDFAPVKYASIQWKRFFEKDKHKRKKDISGEISPQELKIIEKYLTSHSADSDLPVAAGLK